MNHCIMSLLLLLLSLIQGTGEDVEPPLLNQPADFSNVVGVYELAATVGAKGAYVREPILLTLKITGSGPKKYQPQRKYLKILRAEMNEHFFIEPLPQKDRYDAESKTWEFYYLLRAKKAGAVAIPYLWLRYYHPQFRRYQRAFAAEIPLTIQKRPIVLEAPKRMYDIATGGAVLNGAQRDAPSWIMLVAGLLTPPFICILIFRLWQAYFPDDERQRERLRSRAARRALHALEQLATDAPAQAFCAIANRYFQHRLGVAAQEPTRAEMRHYVRRAGYSEQAADMTGDFFQACQECRFSPTDTPRRHDLRAEAIQLIETLENEA